MKMDITPINITVRELVDGYEDRGDNGVVAYGEKLDVRPPYQREFIYGDKERNAVINTINNKYPLNVMYWADREDGTFEIIDGQQRTISVCQYVNGDFAFNERYFHNLTDDEKEKILNYKLSIYICKGDSSEKLDWFKTINIPGKQLNGQELANAVFAGTFVSDAKRYFSKTNGPAHILGKDLVTGNPKRQDYLKTALEWIANRDGLENRKEYMGKHQHDPNAIQLWQYFQTVINWVKNTFDVPKFKRILEGLDWGKWYELKKDEILDTETLKTQMAKLLRDSEVTNKKGIVPYLFTGDERLLGLRMFGDDIREEVYAKQDGVCPICGGKFEIEEMEADHIKPWSKGGKTILENCQMLCVHCNRTKSNS